MAPEVLHPAEVSFRVRNEMRALAIKQGLSTWYLNLLLVSNQDEIKLFRFWKQLLAS